MAQLVVRNLEHTAKAALRRRARRHGRSMEAEAREILRNAVLRDDRASGGLGSAIAAIFARDGLQAPIAELRGHRLEPTRFLP